MHDQHSEQARSSHAPETNGLGTPRIDHATSEEDFTFDPNALQMVMVVWKDAESQGGPTWEDTDDMLEFAPLEEHETQHTLKKGTPTQSVEARAALKNGHRLRRARLTLGIDERVWSFTLDAPTMGLRSIKLPEDDEEAESAEERSRERAANFLELHELVGAVYREFLKIRLRPDYVNTDAEHQAAWMAHG